MIWRFEGGPWDGKTMTVPDTVIAPPYQMVTMLNQPTVKYTLWTTEEPNIFIYRLTNA